MVPSTATFWYVVTTTWAPGKSKGKEAGGRMRGRGRRRVGKGGSHNRKKREEENDWIINTPYDSYIHYLPPKPSSPFLHLCHHTRTWWEAGRWQVQDKRQWMHYHCCRGRNMRGSQTGRIHDAPASCHHHVAACYSRTRRLEHQCRRGR